MALAGAGISSHRAQTFSGVDTVYHVVVFEGTMDSCYPHSWVMDHLLPNPHSPAQLSPQLLGPVQLVCVCTHC